MNLVTSNAIASRRSWLASTGLQAVGLGTLNQFWGPIGRANSEFDGAPSLTTKPRRAKSVIMIFNGGAPSHLDLWDMKPQAPSETRGTFRPIETNVPGIEISELLPEVAKRMDRLAIVRTLHHTHGGHNSGMHWSTVGRPYRIDSTLINPSRADMPCIGTLVGWLAQQDGYSANVPPYVITPAPHCDSTKYLTPGQFGGCLGSRFDPFVLNADPNAKDFRVPGLRLNTSITRQRQQERQSLLKSLDTQGSMSPSEITADIDMQRAKALGLISSDAASEAFDLTKEPDSVRDRYGRHRWGQSHLLARRLIEAGTRFVTTVNGPSITWDTHKDNFNQMKNRLVPPMEKAYVALLDDLSERGLLDETLVIWMGDFGRTPVINKDAGRDHWPQCYSMVLAGGGIQGGQVVGESDKTGAYPKLRPVTPADIHATVFGALGYDAQRITYRMSDDRPMAVSDGHVINELL
ncbi:DUF1501 domain-containing protein [Fuerstiella marisgermanici]|uniref:DUF1501 domain-containing protein n=1 Tax=Fuerstiella marisgermanici TaxID=1891926 RepID=A0A1P8W9G3_9PLAN|nr:DUF1501 domain-containing protein [Fuerstiella marisgermanici]APZ90690.1 hypothetical protein Fuma_00271 [Fuerstiella marisgermanici]